MEARQSEKVRETSSCRTRGGQLQRSDRGLKDLRYRRFGMLVMFVNLSDDLKRFITQVMVLLWPIHGRGIVAVRRALVSTRVHRPIAPATSIVAAAVMPASNLPANYADADQSHATGSGRFLRSVYLQLPETAGVVTKD